MNFNDNLLSVEGVEIMYCVAWYQSWQIMTDASQCFLRIDAGVILIDGVIQANQCLALA